MALKSYNPTSPARRALIAAAGRGVVVTLLLGAGAQLAAPLDDPGLWSWVLLAGVLGAAVPGVALMMGIRAVGPSRAAILMMLEPVVAVLLAGAFLAEEPSPLQIAGGAMVVAAAASRETRWLETTLFAAALSAGAVLLFIKVLALPVPMFPW